MRGLYLCRKHESYEIVEGMVRILGVIDEAQSQVADTRLKQADLHPVVFAHKASPISLGGTDDMIFNEIKIMVPCQEVAQAEKVLREFGILHP